VTGSRVADPVARAVMAALVATGVAEVAFLLHLPLPEQVQHVPDDSFFYLQVAKWFPSTHEFTFDGDNPTYGYQPLWQLLLCALAPLLPGRALLFHGVQILCALLHVALGGALFAFTRRLAGPAAGVVAALLWTANPATMVWCWGLKENALYALLLVAAFGRLLALLDTGFRPRTAAAFGALLGLIVCARLNAVLVAGLLLAALPLARGLGGGLAARLRGAGLALAIALATGAPWYVFARFHFGTAMPISATVKELRNIAYAEGAWHTPWLSFAQGWHALGEWPRYLGVLWERGYGPWRGALVALLLLAPCALARPAWRCGWLQGRARLIVVALVLATALLASFADQMLLPVYIGYADWYSVAFQVAVPVLGGVLAAPWLRSRLLAGSAVAAVACSTLLLPPTFGAAARLERGVLARPPHLVQTLELGLWVARVTPVDARFGLWDPGVISFFSDRHCISFDPLIGAVDYCLDLFVRRTVKDLAAYVRDYVRRQRIAYMFGVAEQKDGAWQFAPLPAGTFDIVWLPWPDFDVGWQGDDTNQRVHCVVVRPHDAATPEFLRADDFPCGLLYPNDPARRRWITRDRDRLLAGVELQADALRLQLAAPPGAPALRLLVDGRAERTFAAGTAGWQCLDVRAFRGHRVQVVADGSDASISLPQAQIVDYELSGR
jgi:hypothetical protein